MALYLFGGNFMSALTLSPCGHTPTVDQFFTSIGYNSFTVSINESAQNAFAQLNEQLRDAKCPLCKRNIERIVPGSAGSQKFPLNDSIFSRISISPLNMELRAVENTAAKVNSVIHFNRIELSNIVNQGLNSNDNGRTYRRLAELANDFNCLVSAFGSVLGRIVYWLPTFWKASAYIKVAEEARQKGRLSASWILSDGNGETVGLLGLSEIEKEKFELDEELNRLKLYNVGVLLHSNFQRRGVVTEITNHLFEKFRRLNLDIDGLWITTRPDNEGVNHIARKLDFSFIKTMQVSHEGLIPCFSSTYIPLNLYVKRLSSDTHS